MLCIICSLKKSFPPPKKPPKNRKCCFHSFKIFWQKKSMHNFRKQRQGIPRIPNLLFHSQNTHSWCYADSSFLNNWPGKGQFNIKNKWTIWSGVQLVITQQMKTQGLRDLGILYLKKPNFPNLCMESSVGTESLLSDGLKEN